jgi:hypothetical protein
MRDEFKFRMTGTSILLSFKELDTAMREQFEYERDRIESRLQSLAKMGVISVEDVDTKMQMQMEHERDHIEKRLVEIFDTRLEQKNDTMSIGNMRAGDALTKFR